RYLYQLLSKVGEAYGFVAAQIEDFSLGLFACTGQKHGLNHVVNVIHIAPLAAFAVQLYGVSVNSLSYEPGYKALPIKREKLTRPIGVSQAKADGARAVDAVIEKMIILCCKFIDAVDVQ